MNKGTDHVLTLVTKAKTWTGSYCRKAKRGITMSYSGFWIEDKYIYGPGGSTQYWIDDGHIYGPNGYTNHWIEDGIIYSTSGGNTRCWIDDNRIYGPKEKLPW